MGMTATEHLRELLDERGVEWSYGGFLHSTYFVVDDVHYSAYEQGGKLYLKTSVGPIAPEQAIDTTLGRGECQFKTVERFIDARRDRADMCECDRCGYRCARGFIQDERFKYCPNCGAKVVGDVLRTE